MKPLTELFDNYDVCHQNPTNKLIHWICVPAIFFSIFGIVMSIPFPYEKSVLINWATIAAFFALIYYFVLSFSIFFGIAVIASICLYGNFLIYEANDFSNLSLLYTSLIIFAIAWVGQFYGHYIEGKKPSFFEDLQYLLIGPAWLLRFIYNKFGISI